MRVAPEQELARAGADASVEDFTALQNQVRRLQRQLDQLFERQRRVGKDLKEAEAQTEVFISPSATMIPAFDLNQATQIVLSWKMQAGMLQESAVQTFAVDIHATRRDSEARPGADLHDEGVHPTGASQLQAGCDAMKEGTSAVAPTATEGFQFPPHSSGEWLEALRGDEVAR